MFYRVEQRDREVLDDAVESHELEDAEGRDEGSPALSSQRKESLGAQLECISQHFLKQISPFFFSPRCDVPQTI